MGSFSVCGVNANSSQYPVTTGEAPNSCQTPDQAVLSSPAEQDTSGPALTGGFSPVDGYTSSIDEAEAAGTTITIAELATQTPKAPSTDSTKASKEPSAPAETQATQKPKSTPAPRARKSAMAIDKSLKPGMRGHDVRVIQVALGVEADGAIGPETLGAFKDALFPATEGTASDILQRFSERSELALSGKKIGDIDPMTPADRQAFAILSNDKTNVQTRAAVAAAHAKGANAFQLQLIAESPSPLQTAGKFIKHPGSLPQNKPAEKLTYTRAPKLEQLDDTVSIGLGHKGPDVQAYQLLLVQQGHLSIEDADGYWGPKTQAAHTLLMGELEMSSPGLNKMAFEKASALVRNQEPPIGTDASAFVAAHEPSSLAGQLALYSFVHSDQYPENQSSFKMNRMIEGIQKSLNPAAHVRRLMR